MKLLLPDQYQPSAEAAYIAIANRLSSVLPVVQIEHVGASAIPGAISKGDLDICVIVAREVFSMCLEKILTLGYHIKADTLRTEQLCMLIPNDPSDDHAIQLIEAGSKFQFFLTFRDALRNNPSTVARYNEVKILAANQSESEYRMAKSAFIAEVLATVQSPCPTTVSSTDRQTFV